MKPLIEIFEQYKLLDMAKRTLVKLDEDYKYGEYDIFYLPHPKLFGNYEIWDKRSFVKRIEKISDAQKIIEKYEDLMSPLCQ